MVFLSDVIEEEKRAVEYLNESFSSSAKKQSSSLKKVFKVRVKKYIEIQMPMSMSVSTPAEGGKKEIEKFVEGRKKFLELK